MVLLLVVAPSIFAQEYRVVDNKGTKIILKNNTLTTSTLAPSDPVENDIWINTSNLNSQRIMIWDGGTWTELSFSGTSGSIFFAGSNGMPQQDNDQLFWDDSNNYFGVGTTVPTQALDVNGYVRVRVMDEADTSDQIVKSDANGLLHISKINYGGRWTNTDTSTNLNVNATVAPIFGSADYVDNGTSLYEISGNTLIVKESGRYDIRANLALVGIYDGLLNANGIGTNVNARIAINGVAFGALAATGHISFSNSQDYSSLHLSEILELSANDVISILTYREANSGPVLFNGSGSSSFMINKLQ